VSDTESSCRIIEPEPGTIARRGWMKQC